MAERAREAGPPQSETNKLCDKHGKGAPHTRQTTNEPHAHSCVHCLPPSSTVRAPPDPRMAGVNRSSLRRRRRRHPGCTCSP